MSFSDEQPQQGASLQILEAYYPVVKALGAYLEAAYELNPQSNQNDLHSSLTSPDDTDAYSNLLSTSYVASKADKRKSLGFHPPMLDMREVSSAQSAMCSSIEFSLGYRSSSSTAVQD